MKTKIQKSASRFILHRSLLLCSLLTAQCSLNAQHYGWTDISGNLPDFYNDTVIINGGADTLIANISGISFLDDNHGWICTYHPFDGEPSAVLETTDGGQTWTEHSAPYAGHDIHMIDEMHGYFGAINGFVYKTSDGAETWTLHGLLLAPLYDLGFPPRPAQTGFAGGKDGHMAQITPEGVFPVDLGLAGSVYCIDFPSEERGYALLDYQMIIFYMDGEWHVEASYPFSSKDWLYFRNDTVGWCVGEMFLKTTVGTDWYRTDPEFVQTGAMMGVFFTDLNNGWAVGTQGQIAYSSDGGNDWTMLDHNLTDEILTGVLFTSPNNGFIIGGEKTLLKYTTITSIRDQGGSGEENVDVWPNPTRGVISLRSLVFCQRSAVGGQRSVMIEIVNYCGKVLKSYNNISIQQLNNGAVEFEINDLPSGMYFIRINLENQMIVKKIIKL
ncbi:MAG: YCF48-related protein [Bacteroidales bacterium]|jgi:hypothetical protein|nr:YCF48-related protein [Bacteroidales bacterium]